MTTLFVVDVIALNDRWQFIVEGRDMANATDRVKVFMQKKYEDIFEYQIEIKEWYTDGIEQEAEVPAQLNPEPVL